MNLETRILKLEADVRRLTVLVEKLMDSQPSISSDLTKNEMLSVNEASDHYNIGASLIYQACANGQIPYEKRGRKFVMKKQFVQRWIEDMQNPQVPNTDIDSLVNKYMQRNPMRG